MSKGPGIIERRIADLFSTTRDRALSIDEIASHAFRLGGAKPTRSQRLSATRAAHRMLRRVRETDARGHKLVNQAHERTKAAVGKNTNSDAYQTKLEQDRGFIEGVRLIEDARRIGVWFRIVREGRGTSRFEDDFWCTITLNKRLYFHPPDAPVMVWAVTIDQNGVHWFDAAVTKITERNVVVRYRGEFARLDRRKLWYWWAFWRGVRFVSSRTGRIANELDSIWRKRYGGAGGISPLMQMPLAEAMALLGVSTDYTKKDVIAAFRRSAKKAHPDAGGTAEMFRLLVTARDRLLAALGTTAPAPKMPQYAPKGSRVVYRRYIETSRRLPARTRRLTSA